MKALVLSGGGAKGGYEIGCWKAFRRLGIDFDIVTGTSVGALIGALVVQKDFYKAYKLWRNMNYNKVIDIEIKSKYSTKKGRQEIISMYAKGAFKGGLEMSGLQTVVDDGYDEYKFYNSNIKYGLITTSFPTFEEKKVTKDNVSKKNMKDYIMASAACFPAFKMRKINNKYYIDGGYTNNLPINLAVELGADEVIAINLGAVGITKKIDNINVPITIIKPKIDLGSFLAFEKEYTRIAIDLGYNDVMKLYGKYDGNIYTFKKNSLKRNYNRIGYKFYSIYEKYKSYFLIRNKIKDKNEIDKEKAFNEVFELTLKAFGIDPSKVYRTSYANILIKKEFLKCELKNYNTIKSMIKNNKLSKMFVNKDLVCYIYNELNKTKKSKALISMCVLFPKATLCAIYLKSIIRGV